MAFACMYVYGKKSSVKKVLPVCNFLTKKLDVENEYCYCIASQCGGVVGSGGFGRFPSRLY